MSSGEAPQEWTQLMTRCVSCDRHCAGIALDAENGIIPRAFAYGASGDKRLAVIFGEPGAGSDLERALFARQPTPSEVLRAVDDLTARCFRQGNYAGRPNAFHQRTTRLLTAVFGSADQAMAACYFTNLTKCQKDAPSIPWATRQACFDLYLRDELRILRPRAALLFGDNATAFAPQVQALGPRVVVAQHPSARPPSWLKDPGRSRLIEEIRAAMV